MKQSFEKPPCESVALHSHDARVLWSMWPPLRVHDELLQRTFETPDMMESLLIGKLCCLQSYVESLLPSSMEG